LICSGVPCVYEQVLVSFRHCLLWYGFTMLMWIFVMLMVWLHWCWLQALVTVFLLM